mgnify:CR=1 FL=1
MQAEGKPSLILSFFPRFLIALIGLQLTVFAIHSSKEISTIIQNNIIQAVFLIHKFLGTQMIVQGDRLIHQNTLHYVTVDNECTGLMLLASVCAALIGLAHSAINTLKMMIIAVLILQTENIIRIAHLFVEVKQPDNSFEFYHLYFWQVINFITGLAVFFILARKFNKKSDQYV